MRIETFFKTYIFLNVSEILKIETEYKANY